MVTKKEKEEEKHLDIFQSHLVPKHEPLNAEEKAELLKKLNDVPENIRMVFNLYAIEGYSHEEISKLLNIPAGTSRWYASEARKLLKEKMEQKFSTVKSLLND